MYVPRFLFRPLRYIFEFQAWAQLRRVSTEHPGKLHVIFARNRAYMTNAVGEKSSFVGLALRPPVSAAPQGASGPLSQPSPTGRPGQGQGYPGP